MSSTQLISTANFDANNIIFAKPLPFGNDFRINISMRNPDGTIGDLVIPTPVVSCSGLKNKTNMDNEIVPGYTMPIRFSSDNVQSVEEKNFIRTINAIVNRCHSHFFQDEVKKACKKATLKPTAIEPTDMTPLYYKDKIVEGNEPSLYPKILERKESKTSDKKVFMTSFYDHKGNKIEDPVATLLDVRCNAQLAIKIDNIYVGGKIRVQAKVVEGNIELTGGNNQKRLLAPLQAPVAVAVVKMELDSKEEESPSVEIEESDDEESEEESD